jgi:threonine dehydrogenase-like Zn-dependent dehydrogenase
VLVVLGHEGLGQIIQIGKGVSTDHASSPIAIGDVVYWNPIRPCNSCYDCTVTQNSTACNHATFWSPANQAQVWASYTKIATLLPNNSFYRVDQRVPLDAYIALGCALPTMLQAVEALGGICHGCTVVVQGAGPVGLAAVMLSKLSGAEHIVCIEGNKLRLEMARRFSATIPVDMGSPEYSDMGMRGKYISRAVGERGVNLVTECSGNVGAFQEGMSLLAPSGKYLLVGKSSHHCSSYT